LGGYFFPSVFLDEFILKLKVVVCFFIFICLYIAIVFCSIIQKAGNALEVLNEVLDAVDAQNPQVTLESFSYRICKTIRL
jgi:hypothetical protein